jgi:pimeloyl-ACP methyl ester carboxylesterase
MPEKRTVEVGGKQIRMLVGGRGPALLYLHSAGADGEWLDAHERLARDFTVHLPSHPGFGESSGLDEVDDVSDLVLHYADLQDVCGLRGAPIVGTSFGGWIAAELAALYPERVRTLVLVDAVGLWIDAQPIAEIFGTTPPELARKMFHDQQHPIAALMHAFTTIADVPEEIALAQMKVLEAVAKVGWNPYLHDPKLGRRLRRVTARTLIVWGREDGITPLAYAERWRAGIPGARLAVIERCGHLPAVERPDELARLVTEFLKDG